MARKGAKSRTSSSPRLWQRQQELRRLEMHLSLKRIFILTMLVLLASLFAVAVAYAQGGGPAYPTDDDVNRVAKKLYCPVCPNTPLDVCETQACKDWRAQIRDELAQGWTEQDRKSTRLNSSHQLISYAVFC